MTWEIFQRGIGSKRNATLSNVGLTGFHTRDRLHARRESNQVGGEFGFNRIENVQTAETHVLVRSITINLSCSINFAF